MLHLLDPYALAVQIKGSTTTARWTKVILTSNQHPSTWYPSQYCSQEQIAALNRRLGTVVEANTRQDLDGLVPPWKNRDGSSQMDVPSSQ